MNKPRIGISAWSIAAVLLCGLLASGTTLAGETIGQFRVGVHVVNDCQIAGTQQTGATKLPSTAGFGLKCSRGADFIVADAANVQVTEPSQAGGTQPPTVVIRF